MHAIIIHHSSTGNTRHCAEVIQSAIREAGHACDLFDTRQARVVDLKGYDLVGAASAVYGFRPAHAMLEYLRDMPAIEGTPAFVLACCSMIPANSLNTMAKMLRLRGGRVLDGIEVRGEESWPALRFPGLIVGRGRPNADDDEQLRRFAARLIERHGQFVSGGDAVAPRFRRFSLWGLIGMVTARPVMRYGMLGKKLNEEKCMKCSRCAENCPMDAIRLDPYPQFGSGCMGCFGCVNLCPRGAIGTPLTWGRVRYRGHGADG